MFRNFVYFKPDFIRKIFKFNWFWVPITAFVVSTILAPKFQAVKTNDGEKLFMKWLLIKGIKEIK